jgi:hypothetical protein
MAKNLSCEASTYGAARATAQLENLAMREECLKGSGNFLLRRKRRPLFRREKRAGLEGLDWKDGLKSGSIVSSDQKRRRHRDPSGQATAMLAPGWRRRR